MKRLALCCLALLVLTAATPDATQHLLQGARHFRDGRFAQALVEFKVSRGLGAVGEADWYIAASLVKLDRAEEALESFANARKVAPEARDALLDYYHALACYQARLYLCADALLAAVGDASGPRIGAQARKLRAEIAELFRQPPVPSSIDWYHERAARARAERRAPLAVRYLEEAVLLAERRKDRHRQEEARAGLVSLGVPLAEQPSGSGP